jgi:hypothetical protein
MALAYVTSVTGVNSATLTGLTQAGDIIVGFAFRDGSTTAPTLPAGWISIATSAGASAASSRVAFKEATGAAETSGTWTNATSVVFHIYRPDSAYRIRPGGAGAASGSSTSVSYPAVTFKNYAGANNSWVVGFSGHVSVNTSLETPPTGMTNRSDVVDATDEAAGHDTNGLVGSWSATAVAVGGTSGGWQARTVEIAQLSRDAFDPSASLNTGTLSNGGRTATGGGGFGIEQHITASGGKFYCEYTVTALTTAHNANAFFGISALGGVSSDYVLMTGDGTVFVVQAGGSLAGGTATAVSQGDVLSCAFDLSNLKAWFRVNGGNWNNSGSANPATNTGGITMSSTSTAYYAYCSGDISTDAVTINTGTSAFSYSAPSGFSPWYSALTNKTLDATTAGSYALTGTAALLKHGYAVQAAAGSYALTGTAASLIHKSVLAAAASSYTLTGTAANLLLKRVLAAGSGAYALTGTDARLVHGYSVQALAGSYSLTGTAATLRHSMLLLAGAGAYSLTGSAAQLLVKRVLAAGAGAYALSGTDAALRAAKKLAADSGSYVLTGTDAALITSHQFPVLPADAGSYALSGSDATMHRSWIVAAASGAYALSGSDANLVYSGAQPSNPSDWLITARRRHSR